MGKSETQTKPARHQTVLHGECDWAESPAVEGGDDKARRRSECSSPSEAGSCMGMARAEVAGRVLERVARL